MRKIRQDLCSENYRPDKVIDLKDLKGSYTEGEIVQREGVVNRAYSPIDLAGIQLRYLGCDEMQLVLHPMGRDQLRFDARMSSIYSRHYKNVREMEETIFGIPLRVSPDIPENVMFLVAEEWYADEDPKFVKKILVK